MATIQEESEIPQEARKLFGPRLETRRSFTIPEGAPDSAGNIKTGNRSDMRPEQPSPRSTLTTHLPEVKEQDAATQTPRIKPQITQLISSPGFRSIPRSVPLQVPTKKCTIGYPNAPCTIETQIPPAARAMRLETTDSFFPVPPNITVTSYSKIPKESSVKTSQAQMVVHVPNASGAMETPTYVNVPATSRAVAQRLSNYRPPQHCAVNPSQQEIPSIQRLGGFPVSDATSAQIDRLSVGDTFHFRPPFQPGGNNDETVSWWRRLCCCLQISADFEIDFSNATPYERPTIQSMPLPDPPVTEVKRMLPPDCEAPRRPTQAQMGRVFTPEEEDALSRLNYVELDWPAEAEVSHNVPNKTVFKIDNPYNMPAKEVKTVLDPARAKAKEEIAQKYQSTCEETSSSDTEAEIGSEAAEIHSPAAASSVDKSVKEEPPAKEIPKVDDELIGGCKRKQFQTLKKKPRKPTDEEMMKMLENEIWEENFYKEQMISLKNTRPQVVQQKKSDEEKEVKRTEEKRLFIEEAPEEACAIIPKQDAPSMLMIEDVPEEACAIMPKQYSHSIPLIEEVAAGAAFAPIQDYQMMLFEHKQLISEILLSAQKQMGNPTPDAINAQFDFIDGIMNECLKTIRSLQNNN